MGGLNKLCRNKIQIKLLIQIANKYKSGIILPDKVPIDNQSSTNTENKVDNT
jgi:hypothetical protein